MQLGLVYSKRLDGIFPRNLSLYDFLSYVNSNFAGDLEDQKLVMGNCFFFNKEIVLQYSKKQRIVSTFIFDAKYIAFRYATKQAVQIW